MSPTTRFGRRTVEREPPPKMVDVEIYQRISVVQIPAQLHAQMAGFLKYAETVDANPGTYIAWNANAPVIDGADMFDYDGTDVKLR